MLLTIKEVATRLQIKPSTLYAWASQGRIPCVRIHGLVRFEWEEVARWVASFRVEKMPKLPHPIRSKGSHIALDMLIARAKNHAYNPGPRGNQTKSSPIGKEKTDGAI